MYLLILPMVLVVVIAFFGRNVQLKSVVSEEEPIIMPTPRPVVICRGDNVAFLHAGRPLRGRATKVRGNRARLVANSRRNEVFVLRRKVYELYPIAAVS